MLNRFIDFLLFDFDEEDRLLRKSISNIVGFRPSRLFLYKLALTHRSASRLTSKGQFINNERLEFLGDAILDAVISDFLYRRFPYQDEGFLTQMRSKIVNGEHLSELTRKIGLDDYLTVISGSFANSKYVYGDAFEALIGAIYLDRGFEKVTRFIVKRILEVHIDFDKLEHTDTNFKSQLIEWAQKYKHDVVFQTETDTTDSKNFVSYAKIDAEIYGTGKGISKKQAEQTAARMALERVVGGNYKSHISFDEFV